MNENLKKITLDCLTDNPVGSVKLENAWSLFYLLVKLSGKRINRKAYTNVALTCQNYGEVCVPFVVGCWYRGQNTWINTR